ncbi:amidase [Falsochrobactrum sp. TDYN1]|uniref:Indoleacetamide hydrolase n=1 Tax=Falsochrobactrum tianjinense TaxID=2706015 RepID=A0A949UWI9_9HYPH|nr:amidase [Falsochrobactrum sp. TDYN1]MBV2145093.1 amidase [Falsochrobactrum sp. TDYN1]
MRNIGSMSILTLRDAIANGQISAVDTVQNFLDQIETSQQTLSAFTTVDIQGALKQAEVIDAKVRRGEKLGPLAGVPVSIKDIIDVEGIATTGCSRSALDMVASSDADVVARLRASDAIIIGKANCHEFAFGGPSFDLPFPPARNPWNPQYFPGGSSSGSGASVAAGLCFASIGTDTAGSIRLPSGHCGVVGLTPTYGSISMSGIRPLSGSMDHVGPMARTVQDCRVVYECLSNQNATSDNVSKTYSNGDLRGARFGMAILEPTLEQRLQAEIRETYRNVGSIAENGGCQVEQVHLPSLHLIHAAASVVMMAEVAANYAKSVRARYQDFGAAFRLRSLAGECVGKDDYQLASSLRNELYLAMKKLFEQVDFVALPVSLKVPGKLTEVDRFYFLGDLNINILANFLHLPTVTLPCGLSNEGLPIGIQIVGRRGSEVSLLNIAEGLERHINFKPLTADSVRSTMLRK